MALPLLRLSVTLLPLLLPPLLQAVQERYQVPAQDLRLYVHYPPSYFHFHVSPGGFGGSHRQWALGLQEDVGGTGVPGLVGVRHPEPNPRQHLPPSHPLCPPPRCT